MKFETNEKLNSEDYIFKRFVYKSKAVGHLEEESPAFHFTEDSEDSEEQDIEPIVLRRQENIEHIEHIEHISQQSSFQRRQSITETVNDNPYAMYVYEDQSEVNSQFHQEEQGKKQTHNYKINNQYEDVPSVSESRNQMRSPKDFSHTKAEDIATDMMIQITDKGKFIISPLPQQLAIRCLIKKNTGFFNKINSQYNVYLANGLQHILSVKKNSFRNREIFLFSTYVNQFQHLCAVLHTNAEHNLYWLLDKPNKKRSNVLVVIRYHTIANERMMDVGFPQDKTIAYENVTLKYEDYVTEGDLQIRFRQGDCLNNSSLKNYILWNEENTFIEMGKQSDRIYQVLLQHPMNMLQAVAISMTRFDAQVV